MNYSKTLTILLALIVLAGILWLPNSQLNEISLVENYFRTNIKSITSENPVLGGQWYVVSVDVNKINKSGTVVYEDGHIQGKASFNYEIIGDSVQIKNFTVKPEVDEPVFCTQEAMMCPDGSYVGRTGPKCEFTACPGN